MEDGQGVHGPERPVTAAHRDVGELDLGGRRLAIATVRAEQEAEHEDDQHERQEVPARRHVVHLMTVPLIGAWITNVVIFPT
jgi:hypothetical protein